MEIRAIANLKRFKEIAQVLLRYGFDDIVDRLDLGKRFLLRRLKRVEEDLSSPERVRRALEELGPTFIKLGQVLSLRSDLLPQEFIKELRKLQDEVEPEDYESIKLVLEDSLGQPVSRVFSSFETTPIAAASISQVHRAVLFNEGTPVAVKVQRTDVRRIMELDLRILDVLVKKLHERESYRVYNLPGIIREAQKSLEKELNFTLEGRNLTQAAANLGGNRWLTVPETFPKYTTDKVLTMEMVEGTPLADAQLSEEEKLNLADRSLKTLARMVLKDGFFHADPHPGNFILRPEGSLCLLDWGMTGRLTRETRFSLVELLVAVIQDDSEKMLRVILDICGHSPETDRRMLKRDIVDLLGSYRNLPLKDIRVGPLLMEMTRILRVHRLEVPMDLAAMVKALFTIEGVARELNPRLNAIEELTPLAHEMMKERWQPREVMREVGLSLSELFRLAREAPFSFSTLMEQMEKGDFTLKYRLMGLKEILGALDNVSSRLTFGIIIAALIIGSSMIITTGVEPLLFGFPAIGLIGYLISGIMGLWLLVNIIRGGKL